MSDHIQVGKINKFHALNSNESEDSLNFKPVVFNPEIIQDVQTDFSHNREYSTKEKKELDRFLGDFLYDSSTLGLQEISNYNKSVGWLNITDRAVNSFKVYTGQTDRIELEENLKQEQKDYKKLKDTAYSMSGAFESQIERKFGIPYSHQNIAYLKNTAEEYTRVTVYHEKYEGLKQGFSDVKNILRQEQEYKQALKYVKGPAAQALSAPSPSSHEKFGEILLYFCNGNQELVNEYMKNISARYTTRAEIEKHMPEIMDELLNKCESEYKDALGVKSYAQYENEYNIACKKVFGKEDSKKIAQNFVKNAKNQAAYTEIGLTIATSILLPQSSIVKNSFQKMAVQYGKKAAVSNLKSKMTFTMGAMPATLTTLNAATSEEGFTEQNIKEIKEKFKNGMLYGGFGAYASGPLGNAVSNILSKKPYLFSTAVSKSIGTATETTADVIFDRITSDVEFKDSLKQNGGFNLGMMIAGGMIHKYLNKLNVSNSNTREYIVKDNNGKTIFKSKDSNELAGFVMAQGLQRREKIKEQIQNGKKLNYHNLKIPRGQLSAPRAGFDETPKAYVDMIKNNKTELKNMCRSYLNGEIDDSILASKFENFLADKMNMPAYPEIKKLQNSRADGEFDATEMTITFDTEDMGRLSKFFGTLMHEMHHFLQTKEILCNMPIDEYANRKAIDFVNKDKLNNPQKYDTPEKLNNRINSLTTATANAYKEAGWDDVTSNYPRNNFLSNEYIRAEKLMQADLNYDSNDLKSYYSNLQETEAHEINVRTELEFEYSILETISKEEYETANKVYSLINENYKDYEPLLNIKASIDADSYSLVELVKEAKSMGVTKPEEIVVLLIDEN